MVNPDGLTLRESADVDLPGRLLRLHTPKGRYTSHCPLSRWGRSSSAVFVRAARYISFAILHIDA